MLCKIYKISYGILNIVGGGFNAAQEFFMKNFSKLFGIIVFALITLAACDNGNDNGGGTAPAITISSLDNGEVGEAYTATLTATGDTPITWSKESGDMPTGLTLSENGAISGTPTLGGTFTFTVKAVNAAGSDTKQLSIKIIEYNKFTIIGDTYEVSEGNGAMHYWGDYYDNNTDNVILGILFGNVPEISSIEINFLVPIGNDRLVAGTYNFSQDYTQFTYAPEDSVIRFYGNSISYCIKEGTVKISVSGTGENAIYTIEINCTLEDEDGNVTGTVTGTYRGTLGWRDRRD